MLHAVSQVRNTQSCVQDELSQRKGKQQAPGALNNSCTIHTALSNNNRTAPRGVRQTFTVHTVLTKNNTRVDSTGKDSGVTEAQLQKSRVATRKYSYQTRESPRSSSALSTACSSPIKTVKVGDQLLPHCRFPMFCRCVQRCLLGKLWSVTCGVLLL